MSFLAPLFLAAIGAVSLPILLHLIRRTPRGKVLFSSLMFLSPTPPRLTKRSSIEHWLLLALRALAVALIALAFARPFVWESAEADAEETGPGRRIALLVDISASMQREDLWTQAKQAAASVMSEVQATDEVTLLAFDRQTRTVVSLEQWRATPMAQRGTLIDDALKSLAPGHAGTQLGQALLTAAAALADREAQAGGHDFVGRRMIALISDLQRGGRLESLDGHDWPAQVGVKVLPVVAKSPTNAGLQIVADRAAEDEAGRSLRLRVVNAADSARDRFTLRLQPVTTAAGVEVAPKAIEIYVPAGESRTVRTGDLSAWWSPLGNAVTLEGDDHPFDNRVDHCASQPPEAVVVYIGSDGDKDPKGLRFYAQLALGPTPQLITRLVPLKPEHAMPPGETDGASLFIIGDAPAADRLASLRSRAEQGATILWVMRDLSSLEGLRSLLNAPSLGAVEASVKDYAMLTEIDFRHPLFAPFADPRFGDFTTIRFWRHRALELSALQDARVLAKFDDGSPALVEVKVGTGRCLILAAGWHPEDGQLALSSKFLPLMNVLLQQSLGRPAAASRLVVGDVIDLGWLAATPAHRGKAVVVTGPDGKGRSLDEPSRLVADQPGVHVVQVGEETLRLAVHQAAGESDTTPLDPSELERHGVRLWQADATTAQERAERKRLMRMTELENKHKIWRWLIVAALGVLMIETFIAGRFSRPAAGAQGASS